VPPPPPPGGGYIPGGGYVPPSPMGYMPGGMAYAGQRTDGLAIASLVVGIIGVVCSIGCLGVVLGPTASIMGFVARQRVASSGGALGGGGMALAGMILGAAGFVLSVAWFLFVVLGSHNTSTG
jgi:Zn-dependent protease